jgi:hypothetical protein
LSQDSKENRRGLALQTSVNAPLRKADPKGGVPNQLTIWQLRAELLKKQNFEEKNEDLSAQLR